jgi:hypothetical protein
MTPPIVSADTAAQQAGLSRRQFERLALKLGIAAITFQQKKHSGTPRHFYAQTDIDKIRQRKCAK